ncbi:hypothetical protein [Nostoc sp.]|uniref:hypothetical protein n=1 Tax=Nostoc sp. TaxID=1180 RepID=UPI002FFAE75F
MICNFFFNVTITACDRIYFLPYPNPHTTCFFVGVQVGRADDSRLKSGNPPLLTVSPWEKTATPSPMQRLRFVSVELLRFCPWRWQSHRFCV